MNDRRSDLVALGTMLSMCLIWQYSVHPGPYIYAYVHHLGYGIALGMSANAFLLLYSVMFVSTISFDAIDVCHRKFCVSACTETLAVGYVYSLLLIGLWCSPRTRALVYPRTTERQNKT